MSEVIIEELPVLFSRSSKGAILEWRISVVDRSGVSSIRVEFGHKDGEKHIQYKDILEGKNLGKKNETTTRRQAILDAASVWRKKKDHGYLEEIPSESFCSFLPMLAHDFKKRGHDIRYPAYVQPKLEGVRCLAVKVAEDRMEYISRNGKKYSLRHLDESYLSILRVGEVVDGEIFNPEMDFEEIISHLKNPRLDGKDLSHWIYDFPSFKGGFEDRYYELSKRHSLLQDPDSPIILVETQYVRDELSIMSWHSSFVEEGFEGTIIRNVAGEYRYDYRSPNLQKYKDFEEEEYEIVGIEPGTGRDSDIGNPICKCSKTGLEFGAPSTGRRSIRQDYKNNPKKYVGKMATVRFQRLTEKGIPYIPKTITVRDYE